MFHIRCYTHEIATVYQSSIGYFAFNYAVCSSKPSCFREGVIVQIWKMGKWKVKGSCNFPGIKFMSKQVLKTNFLISKSSMHCRKRMKHSISEMTIGQYKLL